MPCSVSCMLSLIFIISMIYFQNATTSNRTVEKYYLQLPPHLQKIYKQISNERLRIYYFGYILGFVISLIIIFNNYKLTKNVNKLSTTSLICITVTVSFIVNYFYYILTPKTIYMLQVIDTHEQTKAWLTIYRAMQIYYHVGLLLGIIGVGLLAFAFRC